MNEQKGLVGLLQTVVSGLPASFLGLLVINLVFLGGLFVFLDRQRVDRMELFKYAMDACERKYNND